MYAQYFNTTKLNILKTVLLKINTFSLTLNSLKSVIFPLCKLKIDYQYNLNQNPSKLFCGYCQTESNVYVER